MSSESNGSFLQFKNVKKSYDQKTLVVKDFNLDVAKGEFIRESKFATQDRFVLLRFYELNDNNIEVVADFLARNLPIVQKEQLSLEIDNKEVQFTKEDIKKALKEFLEKKGRQV